MKKIICKLFIFIFFPLFLNAAEIEILSDIPGTGPTIVNHSKISVHYRGTLDDGTEFDSSFKRNQPFVFQIGIRQVIAGWEIGLMGMKVGGKRTIKIPPNLAYGSNGIGNIIPPNATLIFEIEIIDTEPPGYKKIFPYQLEKKQKEGFKVVDIRILEERKKTGIIKNSLEITAFDIRGNFDPNFFKQYDKKIKENYDVLVESILKEKPNGIKGNFILSAYLTSTMGISYRLKLKG